MLEFYFSESGRFNRDKIENPSSAMIFDYKHKKVEIMGNFAFEFQMLSDAYKGVLPDNIDTSRYALSLRAARAFYEEVRSYDITEERIAEMIDEALADASLNDKISTLDVIRVLDNSVGLLEDDIDGLKTAITNIESAIAIIDPSIGNINSSIDAISTNLQTLNTSVNANESRITTLQTFVTRIESSLGVADGIATLDDAGKVPSSQLPSYVDDVIEYDTSVEFPDEGESGKIYVSILDDQEYRWTGTKYTQISKSLALGETSSTAYAGDKGKRLHDDFVAHDTSADIHITVAERNAWNGAVSDQHTHDNKALLDAVTDASFHSHGNKDVLDSISDSSFHTHDNKSVIDGITTLDVSNWNDASAKAHTHENAELLASITDASVATWTKDTSYGAGNKAELTDGSNTEKKVWDASVLHTYISERESVVNGKLNSHKLDGSVHITNEERITWNTFGNDFTTHSANSSIHITDAERLTWNESANKSHEHANKAFLDGLSDASLAVYAKNASLADYAKLEALDDYAKMTDVSAHVMNGSVHISDEERTAWWRAFDVAHTHDNQTLLDGITDASIEVWESNKSYETGTIADLSAGTDTENKAWSPAVIHNYISNLDYATNDSLDVHTTNSSIHITSEERIAWDDAADKAHTHTNKNILAGITNASIAAWEKDTSYVSGTLDDLKIGNSSVDSVWSAETIKNYVDFRGFVTNASLADYHYVTNASLDARNYVTNASLEEHHYLVASDLDGYVTDVSLAEFGFVTNSSVADNYLSLADFADQIDVIDQKFAELETEDSSIEAFLSSIEFTTYTTLNTSVNNIYNIVSRMDNVWAAAWNQLKTLNPSLNWNIDVSV